MGTIARVIESFVQQLARMQWSDYLDIILVAYLIYRILPLIRSTSTARIAKAVVAVIVVAWLTDILELHTMSFILSQFLAVGLLALVVLFQPELRRMLGHLGSVKIKSILLPNNKPVQEMDVAIAQTVMACEVMSREKVGALIVFVWRRQAVCCPCLIATGSARIWVPDTVPVWV